MSFDDGVGTIGIGRRWNHSAEDLPPSLLVELVRDIEILKHERLFRTVAWFIPPSRKRPEGSVSAAIPCGYLVHRNEEEGTRGNGSIPLEHVVYIGA